ncbi:MAG TPA: hypothetical protein VMW24_28620, partial [Sedimentisphaerales bacterium]|nr:hypothetical protein [Sedimentisphaerales bacterium]
MAKNIKIACKGSRMEKLTSLEVIQGALKELSPQNLAKLRTRIETKGFDAPFFVWQKKILDGTQRKKVLDAMIADGWTLARGEVPVCEIQATSLDDAKDRLLGYVSQYGKVTFDGLREYLDGIEMPDLGTIDLPDFDWDRFEATILNPPPEGLTDPDAVPDPPKKPISKTGDLWVLGDHRLLCGDAARAVNVKALMGQSRAALMNTDPPYGVAYANDQRSNPGVAKPRVANDTLHDEKLQAFLETIFTCACDCALKKNAAWYLWHAHLIQGFFAAAAAAAAADVILHRQIIWVKPVLLLGRGQYHWKHEPCFMGWVKGHSPPDYGLGNGERTQTTVWEIAGVSQTDRKKFNH